MATVNPIAITLGTSSIEITPTGEATQLIPKALITGVYPVRIQTKPSGDEALSWKYPHDKIIVVDVRMADDSHFSFDLQNVTNQVTWTADQTGQDACIDDFNTWLVP
jgi:hypothetical protein